MEAAMADGEGEDRVEAVWKRAERRNAVDAREADALAASRKDRRKAMKRLAHYERDKPTPEQAAAGAFEVTPAERFDTSRKGEKVLVNLTARGRGAATMLRRNQISAREFRAAEKLCELFDRSQASQLSGVPMSERVDGGAIDTTGARLRAASAAYGEYREAMEGLTQAGRVLVENVVVYGVAMEHAVRMRTVSHRMGALKSIDNQKSRAAVLIAEALESLADHFRIKR
jgi:hypothetical protein